jgi:transcriptional regulator with XRE-family HTH domain
MRLNHEALRIIRERSGQSQTETAKLANIDRANYAHIEAGRRRGTEAQVVAIAAALKVPVTAIIQESTGAVA